MAVPINCLDLGSAFDKPLHSLIKTSYVLRNGRIDFADFSQNACRRPSKFCRGTQRFLFSVQTSHLQLEIRPRYGHILCSLCNHGDKHEQETKEEDISRVALIWRAIKLPIYSVALVPLTVGCAAAYLQTGLFSLSRYFMLLASSVLVITWLNLSNDVYDFDTGADKNKKESIVNLLGSRSGTLIAAYSSLALGFTGLAWTSLAASSVKPILLLSAAIVCGYVYQCPPFRLSYHGLGEPLCFSAFGPFATTAFYLVFSGASEAIDLPLTSTIFCASLLVGFTTSLILFCSHFHQIEEDKAVGKISPLVRLGTEDGSRVVKVAVTTLYSILFAFGLSQALPLTCVFLCGFTVSIGKLVVDYVNENHKDKGKIFMAKYYCVRLHALFGAALAAGLVSARLLRNSTTLMAF